MNWLKIDNPEIDTAELQREIDAEIEEMKKNQELSSTILKGKHSSTHGTPDENQALIEIADAYTDGWDTATLARRRPILKPFLPILEKLLKKFLKPQYVFNSLLLEIIRKQEERIQLLEKKGN